MQLFSSDGVDVRSKEEHLFFVIRYQRPNARHHPPRNPTKELKNHRVRGRVHAVVMVPIDETSQASPRPLVITHLAADVQNNHSLRSSITLGITRPPE
jgi:hypothetical protein